MTALSRRSLLAGLAASAAAPSLAQVTVFSSVAVDASYLRATGQGLAADLVETVMTDELRRLFADRIGGRGPRLVVRVTQLHLTGFPAGGTRGGGGASDAMDGEALIVGPRGEVLAAYPLFAALGANGATRDLDNEPRRVVAVSRFYAQWLRRKIS
jgi:hypothetical protein